MGLQLKYNDFALELGVYLGYGSDPAQWTSLQTAQIDRCIERGYNQFLYPQTVPDLPPINWTFLNPIGQLDTLAPKAGTRTANTTLSLTDSTAAFGNLIGATVQITTAANIPYTRLISANDATSFTWLSAGYYGGAITDSLVGATYNVWKEDYDLPADFGKMIGRLMFSPDDNRWWSCVMVDEQDIRLQREIPMPVSYGPLQCALSAKASDGSAQQRWQLMFWPRPDRVYHLNYRYESQPQPLSQSYPYPLGSVYHSEVILASCLAVAELRIYDQHGAHWENFVAKLQGAALKDRQIGPTALGVNSNGDEESWNREYRPNLLRINGQLV